MNKNAMTKNRTLIAVAVSAALLAGCGGGGDEGKTSAPPAAAPSGPTAAPITPPTDVDAMRFLSQATMGPNGADLARLKQVGFNNWIEEQFAAPRTSHQDFVISEIGLDGAAGAQITMDPMYRSWWKQALVGNDQ